MSGLRENWLSIKHIVAVLLAYSVGVVDSDTSTGPDDWLASGCTHDCQCSFTTSLVSPFPLRTANCSAAVFSSTKFHLSRQTESLLVSGIGVDLAILTAVMFRDGSAIRQLVLSQCHLHSFDGLAAPETLHSVNASHNELVSLSDSTFVRLASLRLLDLSHNRLEVIHRYAFAGLEQLRHLDVSANYLSGAFEGLRWVCELPHIEVLNLSHNGIHVLDDSTFACSRPPDLESSSVHQRSTTTSVVAPNRTHLHLLDLSFNRIRHVHSGAFLGLGPVDIIRLNDNALLLLPRHMVQLTSDVQIWDFSGNAFEVLERGSFRDIRGLRQLQLNRIHRLRMIDAETFVNLTSLERLELSENHNLRYISRSALVDLPNLSSLILTDSGLDVLELDVVSNLPALRELDLNRTQLTCDCHLQSLLEYANSTETLTIDWDQTDSCWLQKDAVNPTTIAGDRLSHDVAVIANDTISDSNTAGTPIADNERNGTSGILSSNVTEHELCHPRIIELFNNYVHVTVTDILRLDCRAVGFPVPTVSWLLPADFSNEVLTTDDMSTLYGTQVTFNNGTLLINAVAMRHHGNYTCLAENGGNHSDQRSVFVHVTSPGTSLILLHVTSSAVTVTWRGLHTSRDYRIRYREKLRDFNATPTARRTRSSAVKPYMRSFTASNLQSAVLYTFCMDVRQVSLHSWYPTLHRGRFVAVDCTVVATRHRKYHDPLARSLAVHVLTGTAAALASLGLLFAISAIVTRSYDRRKLRQAALHSASVTSGGILLQRDDDVGNGTGSVTSFAVSAAASVTFENRAATSGITGDSDDYDFVTMFDSDDLDEIRTTATMKRI